MLDQTLSKYLLLLFKRYVKDFVEMSPMLRLRFPVAQLPPLVCRQADVDTPRCLRLR